MLRERLLILACLVGLAPGVVAQESPQWAITERSLKNARSLPLDSNLFDASQMMQGRSDALRNADTRAATILDLRKRLGARDIESDEALNVKVEIVGSGEDAIEESFVQNYGGIITETWRHLSVAWVPANRLAEMALNLPQGFRIRIPLKPHSDATGGEGAIQINSDDWRDNSANGTNILIGVIDSGFAMLTNAVVSNDAPVAAKTVYCDFGPTPVACGVATIANLDFTTRHGSGCTEAVFDHAPGANYVLYYIDDLTSLGQAINDATNRGVNILTHSITWYNTGWADDSGAACLNAQAAANAGILFFTSAGNRGQSHWQGTFNTGPDFDARHDWVNGDELNAFILTAGQTVSAYLQWNTNTGPHDYDLYLMSSNGAAVRASSTSGAGIYESLFYSNNNAFTETVNLRVDYISGSVVPFEIFLNLTDPSLEYVVTSNSTTSPSNCSDPLVLSVAAVAHTNFGTLGNVTNIIKDYSSRGPSNNGNNICPDIAGPTDTRSTAYRTNFTGTSCATPNMAGAAAALWSGNLGLNAAGVRHLLLEQAEIFRDWGTPGYDTMFGRGGGQLHTYATNTIWIDANVTNATGSTLLPFQFATHASSNMIAGGRSVYLGGNYPNPHTFRVEQRHETIVPNAVVGE